MHYTIALLVPPKSSEEQPIQWQWPKAQRHPPIAIESFAHWLSWCPSSNAFATWNSLTPTIRSWPAENGGEISGSMSCAPVPPKRKHLRRKLDLWMPFKLVPPISSNHFKSLWKSICWGNFRSEIYLVNLNHLATKYLYPTHSTLEQRGWGENASYLLINMVHVYFSLTLESNLL